MSDVTRILERVEQGDGNAAEELLPLVYEELRKLAGVKMALERPGQTLRPRRWCTRRGYDWWGRRSRRNFKIGRIFSPRAPRRRIVSELRVEGEAELSKELFALWKVLYGQLDEYFRFSFCAAHK